MYRCPPPAVHDVDERRANELHIPINVICLSLTINLDAPHNPLVAASQDVPALHELTLTCLEHNMQIQQGLEHLMQTHELLTSSEAKHNNTGMHSSEANDKVMDEVGLDGLNGLTHRHKPCGRQPHGGVDLEQSSKASWRTGWTSQKQRPQSLHLVCGGYGISSKTPTEPS